MNTEKKDAFKQLTRFDNFVLARDSIDGLRKLGVLSGDQPSAEIDTLTAARTFMEIACSRETAIKSSALNKWPSLSQVRRIVSCIKQKVPHSNPNDRVISLMALALNQEVDEGRLAFMPVIDHSKKLPHFLSIISVEYTSNQIGSAAVLPTLNVRFYNSCNPSTIAIEPSQEANFFDQPFQCRVIQICTRCQ